MIVRRTPTVSITPPQGTLVRGRVRSGGYASASHVVRAALRLLDQDESLTHAERTLPLRVPASHV